MSALLPQRMVEKPWGRTILPPPFTAPAGQRIGEIWFEPPAELDSLMVKYIFASEKLSVQVHPPGSEGKEECWLVIDADPGSVIGVGLDHEVGAEEMRAAALDGSIEQMMTWREVSAGDFIYIPSGTVHAIGAGVSLIEVQQNKDVTYRLYDYGRPRELHLDEAIAVAKGEPHDPALRCKLPASGPVDLTAGPYFRLVRIEGPVPGNPVPECDGPLLAIPLKGEVRVAGELAEPGQCALACSPDLLELGNGAQCLLAWPSA